MFAKDVNLPIRAWETITCMVVRLCVVWLLHPSTADDACEWVQGSPQGHTGAAGRQREEGGWPQGRTGATGLQRGRKGPDLGVIQGQQGCRGGGGGLTSGSYRGSREAEGEEGSSMAPAWRGPTLV